MRANAGLLFLVPGKDENVRVNGAGELTDAPTVLDRCLGDLRRPKLALVLTVREVFCHCAKAFLRAQLWQPDSWARVADAPDLIDMYACMHEVADPDALRRGLAQSYIDDLAHETVDRSRVVVEALPAGVGDRPWLEEQAIVGAGERGLFGHGHAAALDDLAVRGGARGVVATIAADTHGPQSASRWGARRHRV